MTPFVSLIGWMDAPGTLNCVTRLEGSLVGEEVEFRVELGMKSVGL